MSGILVAMQGAVAQGVLLSLIHIWAGDIATCYADAAKAKEELGWEAKRGIDDMCADGWRWQSMNPNGYREA